MLQNLNLLKKHYDKNGWVKIENFISKKNAASIKKKIKLFLKKDIYKYSGRDVNFVEKKNKKYLNSFHRMDDINWVKKFASNKDFKKKISFFLEGDPELRASELFAKPKNFGLKAPIHQDNFYWNVKKNKGLTAWISLSTSDKTNGGVFYFNGSHKYGVLKHKPSFSKGSSQTIQDLKFLKKFKKNTPKLKTGDMLIHHCLVIHGSKNNKSNNQRLGWTFQFKDRSTPYDKKKIKKYEMSLKKQIKMREK